MESKRALFFEKKAHKTPKPHKNLNDFGIKIFQNVFKINNNSIIEGKNGSEYLFCQFELFRHCSKIPKDSAFVPNIYINFIHFI